MEINDYTIYVHISPTNKMYFGATKLKPSQRWNRGKGYDHQSLFWKDIEYYGWDNFQHIILLEHLSKEIAYECEKYLIAKYKSNVSEFGYNIYQGGDCGSAGISRPHSVETKLKIGRANKGRPISAEHKEINRQAQLGRKHSTEVRKKMSISHLKLYEIPEARKKCHERTLKGWETRRRRQNGNQ